MEVKCRVVPEMPKWCQLDKRNWRNIKGSTGENLFVKQELDEEALKRDLQDMKKSGIQSLAVVLMHSYT